MQNRPGAAMGAAELTRNPSVCAIPGGEGGRRAPRWAVPLGEAAAPTPEAPSFGGADRPLRPPSSDTRLRRLHIMKHDTPSHEQELAGPESVASHVAWSWIWVPWQTSIAHIPLSYPGIVVYQ